MQSTIRLNRTLKFEYKAHELSDSFNFRLTKIYVIVLRKKESFYDYNLNLSQKAFKLINQIHVFFSTFRNIIKQLLRGADDVALYRIEKYYSRRE